MTKNLLKQVMIKDESKSKKAVFSIDGLVEKIQSGYTVNRGPKHQQKKTFAPSTIAYGHGECPRYWYLAFDGGIFEDKADPYGVANMTSGTMSHDRIQQAMLDSGIAKKFVNDKGEETTEFKITYSDPPIFGYGDAMLTWNDEDIVCEIKTMPSEGFEYFKSVNKPKKGHLVQLLIYMKILNKKHGVLIYENKNNHELLVLPVEVNSTYIKWVDTTFEWMRTVKKAWKDRTMPKKNYRSNAKVCKSCPLANVCAEAEVGSIKIESLEELSEVM